MRTLVGGVLVIAAGCFSAFTDMSDWDSGFILLVGVLCLLFGDR